MKINLPYFARNLIAMALFCALFGCAQEKSKLPEDMPMSEFMIGEWKVISIVNTDTGEKLEISAPKVSISNEAISYGDVFRAEYDFVGDDTIFVDNKRLTGGETWRLERDQEYLIIYQEHQDWRSTTKLERSRR